MSQPPDNEKVTKNNERLFSIYENQLRSSNVKDYTETAAKLTVWLGNSKAYYTTARPMIVKLLIIAQMTLRGAVGYSLDISVPFMPAHWLDHPLTASYVVLVQTTRPFADLFVETPLKNAINHLLQAIEGIPLFPAPLPTTSRHASSPLPSSDSRSENHLKEISTDRRTTRPASSQGSQIIQEHSSNTGAEPTPLVKGEPSVNFSQYSTLEQALQNSPSTSDLPNTANSKRDHSPEITFIGTSYKPTTESHGAASSAPPKGIPSSAGPSRQGLRAKKPKKIDLSAFVENDIQDFKQKQAQVQRGASDPVQIKKEIVEEISLTTAKELTDVEGIESMAPPPSSPSHTQTQHSPHQNQSLQGHAPPGPQLHSELVGQAANHNLERSESSSQLTVSQTLGQQKPSTAHVSPILSPQPKMDSFIPLDEARTISTDTQVSPIPPSHTTDPPLASSPPAGPTIADYPTSVVTPPANQPTEEPPGAPVAPGVAGGTPQPVASVEAQTTASHIQMRPLLIPEDSDLARFLKLYETFTIPKPHLSVESDMEPEGGENRQRGYVADDMAALLLEKETLQRRFQVVAFTRGGTRDSFTEIAFNLTQSDMDYLSMWLNKRASQLKDTASSYCLSLGCYSSRELMKRLGKQLHATIEASLTEAIASMPSIWPQIGGLSMNVHFYGSRRDLPLAPPLVTTVDGYVDISEFALLGRNSITIHQEEKDISDYMFVLHAHNPTLGQLQEIVRQRKSEMEWRDWLADVTRPLHIDVPPLPPTPS